MECPDCFDPEADVRVMEISEEPSTIIVKPSIEILMEESQPLTPKFYEFCY